MKSADLSPKFLPCMNWHCLLENLAIALLYVVCARVSQLFAIEPGNVTPIWIPSGVMLALALTRGSHIWPGVFLGAFLGNIWAYFSLESFFRCFAAIASATLNGFGDVLSTVVAAQLILRITSNSLVIRNEKNLTVFILLGVILGPLASTLLGVGGLFAFGHIEVAELHDTFITWWVGDATGCLIFTPFLLAWINEERFFDRRSIVAMSITIPFSLLVAAVAFNVVVVHFHFKYIIYLLLPIFFITLFRHGQRQVFSVQLAVVCFAVIATSNGYGAFADEVRVNALLQLQAFAGAFSLVLFTVAILNLEKTRNEEKLEKRTQELEELYRKDALTGLWNRYRITEFLDVELRRFKRTNHPFGVLLLDIDDFKKINDHHGHLAGDEVLTKLATLVQANVRGIDLVGRWGGEEFIIIVSQTNENSLSALANKLVELVSEHEFGRCQRITISIGMVLCTDEDSELTLLDKADAALYVAKNNGKNQATFG